MIEAPPLDAAAHDRPTSNSNAQGCRAATNWWIPEAASARASELANDAKLRAQVNCQVRPGDIEALRHFQQSLALAASAYKREAAHTKYCCFAAREQRAATEKVEVKDALGNL